MNVFVRYILATVAVGFLTWLIIVLHLESTVANVSMCYLLVVILSALLLGRGPAIWASLLAFLACNWFFVNPRYTFNVQEHSEWLALCMFLVTASVTGQLMALLKARAWIARQHQRETAALAEASWAVASQIDTRSALVEVLQQVSRVVQLEMSAVLAWEDEALQVVALHPPSFAVVQMEPLKALVLKADKEGASNSQPDGFDNLVLHGDKGLGELNCLPVVMNNKKFGFVVLKLATGNKLSQQQWQVVNALVSHAAVILQRRETMKSETSAQALADADRLKTALLSMVSHDFRSPLTSIKASVSTLLHEGSPLDMETSKGLYQAIDQETDRLNRMVGNILDLSRLEANAWRPKLEPTPVTELIGMSLDTFSAADNQRIVLHLDPELPDLNVDCVQMVQVLKNLIENALKYSDQSNLVEIAASKEPGLVLIEVLDRGRGINQKDKEHLFEPFFRSPGLNESSIPGTGVGLAVCKGLVEAHGGILTAENREGGGALFRVSLPLTIEN